MKELSLAQKIKEAANKSSVKWVKTAADIKAEKYATECKILDKNYFELNREKAWGPKLTTIAVK